MKYSWKKPSSEDYIGIMQGYYDFLEQKFRSQEIIIKEQHNCRSTKYWENQNNSFLMLAHEYIFIFKK